MNNSSIEDHDRVIEHKITLYCLPFAGGNSYSYRVFNQRLPNFIKPHPLELPGRGKRIKEPLLISLDNLVEDVWHQIQTDGLRQPYAIFGHSMGALLGYLLTQRISQALLPLPQHLFLSGRYAPSIKSGKPLKYNLAKAAFLATLRELEGCPQEVLAQPELIDFFEPVLRADFQAIETWDYQAMTPINVPMTVLWSTGDREVSYTGVSAWQQECLQPVVIEQFSGGHFFIFEQVERICQLFAYQLGRT